MKKKLTLIMAAVMSLSIALTGCGGGGTTTDTSASASAEATGATESTDSSTATDTTVTSTGDKQLVVQIGPNPETLDPALNSASDGGNMLLHSFEGLLIYNQDNEIVGGQAETWKVSEDGLTWTFHLRDGLKWSDGSDLTANDFVYAWKRIADPLTAAPYADTVLSPIEGFTEANVEGKVDALAVTATDDLTLEVKLSAPCTYFGSLAAFATLSPVQQATIEANGDAWATTPETYISNGAFYVSEWVQGSHIIMTKNPYYWNADAITLGSIKFLLMEDANAAYSAFQTGEALMIKTVPTEEIPTLTGTAEFHVDTILGTYYINLNNDLEEFSDSRVREALSLAIDREYVANTLMQGTYTPASNFIGPGWLDTDGATAFMDNANGGTPYIDNTDYEGNLAKAKELLAEAGYPDGVGFPTVTYSTNDAGYHKVVAEYLQQAWGELGLTVIVDVVEWASFTPMRRNGEYQAARNGWVGDYDDPSNMLDLLFSTNGNNDGNYSSFEYDRVMDIARSTADVAERSEALHAAEDVLMEDVAVIPVAYYNDFWLQSEKITGSWHSAYGYWYFMYADIAE